MSVSLAALDNRVVLGLHGVADYLTLEEVHNSVVQRLNARTMQSRTSDINVLLAKTDPFTVDTIPYDVTGLIGKSKPAWVEALSNTVGEIDRWFPVRIVPLQQLGDYTAIGGFACAFYGEEPDNNTDQPTQFLSFTYLPGNLVRIRYDRDLQRTDMASDILLPDNVSELIVLEAQNSLIPRLKNRIAMGLRRDEDGRKDVPLIMSTLNDVYLQNKVDIEPLKTQWMVWCYRDSAAQSAFNLPTPRSENLYVGGRGWGGYFGNGGGW